MNNEEYLYLVLALLFAWVFCQTVVTQFVRRWQRNRDANYVLNTILENLSFQWMFYEEIEDGLFTSPSPELQKALARMLNGDTRNRALRIELVQHFVNLLQLMEQVTTTEIQYSRKALKEHPHRFQFLPAWKRQECEDYLVQVAMYKDDDVVMVGQSLPLFGGNIAILSAVEAGDVGIVLCQIKRRPQGNSKDPKDEQGSAEFRPAFT